MNPASIKELQLRVRPVDDDDDDDDDEQPPRQDFEFYMEGEAGEMKFAVEFEQGAISEIWERLLAACQTTKQSYLLDWSPSNGEANIRAYGDYVDFTVAKYGDGCGGDMTVSVPKAACVSAFEKAVAASRPTRRQAAVSEV